MRFWLLILIAIITVLHTGCKKSAEPSVQMLPVLDSINTVVTNASSTSQGNPVTFYFPVTFKFEHSGDKITRMDRIYYFGSNTYYFSYSGDRLVMINGQYGDTIRITYPSPGVTEVKTYLTGSTPETIVLRESGGTTSVQAGNYEAVLTHSADNIVLQKNYSAGQIYETIEHEFYPGKENPIFYISQRLRIPFFTAIFFPDTRFTDLAQYYSRNTFKSSKITGLYGGSAPFVQTFNFPDSTYSLKNNRVDMINYILPGGSTGSGPNSKFGISNLPAYFTYK